MLPKEEAKVNELQTFEITAYTNGPSDTGKAPGDPDYGITASGSTVKSGDCACPPEIPFGTKVYIPEMGRTFTCTDRGGDIKGRRLDIYMPSRSSVKQFGRQRMQVEIKR
jgi:3D (Asp-Asp-Asp) domain-containing protein